MDRRGDGAPVYAALDLGTNNCRLLIARGSAGPASAFQVIDAFSRIVRLGEQVQATGALTDAAMNRTIDALGVCAGKLARRSVTHYRGVATQACRQARNGSDFLARVERETGLKLDLIAPNEEAQLAFSGCITLLDPRYPDALLFDIGGGSTEVSLIRRDGDGRWRIADLISLETGVVPMAERFAADRVAASDYEAMVAEVAARLEPFETRHRLGDLVREGRLQMIGTSGTVTTLVGVKLDLPRYNRNLVDGQWLTFAEIDAAIARITALDHAGRAAQPCIGPERADLVVPGCAILDAICRVWPVGRLRVADRGLREGIILSLMTPRP